MNWESWLICTLNTTLYVCSSIHCFDVNIHFSVKHFIHCCLCLPLSLFLTFSHVLSPSLSLSLIALCVCCKEAHFPCAPNVNIFQLNPWFFENICTSVRRIRILIYEAKWKTFTDVCSVRLDVRKHDFNMWKWIIFNLEPLTRWQFTFDSKSDYSALMNLYPPRTHQTKPKSFFEKEEKINI